ncbi:MFS transporter [Paraburkholderia ginsengiterrae]|uniref:MFS transporter n=1 Tax=Paraburkholderia ginsengiterrae TaxID=1462993 RepID=A0A1A9N1G6_9BURK|nr:MFS transporter [Paraburkholderia ginsengiterrae]OAJ54627.1 MFS transporter [Paraburkholderia ginsengiterrae]OAJ62696.1 MFS transporter [Paraburkholderia ginsengiterrae]
MGNESIAAVGLSGGRSARHRWKVLGVGFAANASFSAAFSGIPTTAVLLRSGYHLGNDGLGLALGMLGLGIAVSELPWGMLTDRWGDRRVLLLGLLSTAAALAGMALFVVPSGTRVPGVTALALGLLLVGLLGGSVNGSSGRAVMAWFREGERGLAMSIRQTAVPAGGGLGALLLPVLASRFGFTSVYTVLALACAITAIFAWRWLHEPSHADAGSSSAPTARGTAAAGSVSIKVSPLRDVGIWRVALGAGALCVPQIAVITFGTVFLHDFSRAGVLAISVTMAAVQTGAAIARVWSGGWTDRRGNRRAYMRACSLLTAVLFASLAAMTGFAGMHHTAMTAVFALMVVLGGVSGSAWHGVAFTELATLAGTSRAGTALAMGNTCVFLTLFLTPLAIPALLSVGSWPMVWAVASVCALIALPVFPRAAREGKVRAARACDAI